MELRYDSAVDFMVWAFIVQGYVRMWKHPRGRLHFSDVARMYGLEPIYAS